MKFRKYIIITLTALLIVGCSRNSSELSTSSIPSPTSQLIDFFVMNDFHGALLEDREFSEPGFAKAATFLKERKNDFPEQTIILSTGDMWQGSFESYFKKGEVVTEVMNDIGFDAMALGNHEFDWGTQYILTNEAKANFPFLGANIMKYPEITEKSSIGEEYIILQKGDVKVGVIGGIGQDQITSISSNYVENIYFASPTEIVKTLSQKLRTEEDVDIVALAIHTGQESIHDSLAEGGYVDVVFNAHTHRNEKQVRYKVPYIQGGSKGRYISHVQFEVNLASKNKRLTVHKNISVADLRIGPDEDVANIISAHKRESDVVADREVGTLQGAFDKNHVLPNAANYATALAAEAQGFDIDFVISNAAREPIPSGLITYSDLFKGLPFDNTIYVARITGKDLKYESGYSSTKYYRVSDYPTIDPSEYYTAAVIEYMLLHQNTSKQYNYFRDYNPATDFIDYLKDENGNPIYQRDIFGELLESELNSTLSSNDIRFNNNRFTSITAV